MVSTTPTIVSPSSLNSKITHDGVTSSCSNLVIVDITTEHTTTTLVAPRILDLMGTNQTLEGSHLGTATRKNYIRKLVESITFIFDSNE